MSPVTVVGVREQGSRRPGSRLVRRLLAVEVATVLLTVLIAAGVSATNTRSLVEADAADTMLGLARSVAVAPGVPGAVAARESSVLQPAAEAVRNGAGASFVTIMDPAGTRLSHPDPSLIGRTYQGTFLPAARGRELVETFPGTLGPSVRAIVPIRAGPVAGDPRGPVVGMVAVGLLRVDVAGRIARQLAVLGVGAAVAVALGVLLAVAAARRVRRDTLGLEPREITALHRHHEAVLHAMREGLLVVEERSGRVAVLNDEAARLLGVDPVAPAGGSAPAATLSELGVDPVLRERLADPAPIRDETVLVGDRLLLVNRTAAGEGAGVPSAVVTLRDRTEMESVVRELDDARSVAGALRFRAHEHANHLQAVATLVELGAHDDARDLAVRWSRDLVGPGGPGDGLGDRVADPALAALVLDKAVDARDRGLELQVDPATVLPVEHVGGEDESDDRLTLVGNLLDNALDAALEGPHDGVVGVLVTADADGTLVRVTDDGPGLTDPRAFTTGWTTKGTGEGTGAGGDLRRRGLGLALVSRVVDRRGGTLDVGPGPDGPGTTVTVHLPPASRDRGDQASTASR